MEGLSKVSTFKGGLEVITIADTHPLLPLHEVVWCGNGPLADRLRNTPPDLTTYTARNGGVFPSERLRRIIDGRDVRSHGERDMPVWGDAFKSPRSGYSEASVQAQIDAILKYLQGIQVRAGD